MPSSRAFAFIRRTNSSTSPPTYSAAATEASLADRTAIPFIRSPSAICVPGRIRMRDPLTWETRAPTSTMSVVRTLPSPRAS